MTDLFNYLKSKNKKLYVFPIYESWIDLANSSDLNEAKQFLK